MKKLLLAGGVLAMLFSTQRASAQAFTQNFDTGIPATWTLISDGLTPNAQLETDIATGLVAKLTAHAWDTILVGTGNAAAVTTSWFNPAGAANRWMITPAFNVTATSSTLVWDDWAYNPYGGTFYDSIQVLISPTAGNTAAAFTTTLYSGVGTETGFGTHAIDLSAYMGTSVTVAFRDHSYDKVILLVDNVKVTTLPSADLSISNTLPNTTNTFYAPASGTINVYGTATNNSLNNVTAFTVNTQINGGAVTASPITGVNIAPFGTYDFTATGIPVPATLGAGAVKMWVTIANDGDHSNDTATGNITIMSQVASKMVMMEEFTGASCDPCAAAAPNVDAVINATANIMNPVRYHVWFPGRDCMDTLIRADFVEPMLNYYGVTGVPDAQLDGAYVYPGAGGLSAAGVARQAAVNSPFGITVTAAHYDDATNTYTGSADITAYTAFPAGLVARTILSVDSLRYHANQSQESIPQTLFPEVAEHMFPTYNGTTLGAFTAGQTQTINVSWVKDHPWGSAYSVWPYDSSAGGRITVYVQDPTTTNVYQSAYKTLAMNGPAGITNVTAAIGNMSVFPNPASNNATLHLELTTANDLNISVTDMTGREVFSNAVGHVTAGELNISIPTATFANGMYNVLVKTAGGTATQRLSVIK